MQFRNENFDGIKAEDKCETDNECVAIVRTKDASSAILINHLDLDSYKVSEDKVTLLKIINTTKDTNVDAPNASDEIDKCCPEHPITDTNELLRSINDTMPRISCSIPKEEFLNKYVKRRKAVILVNCSQYWVAQTSWSLEKLLNEKNGNLKWRSDFESQNSYFNTFHSEEALTGSLLRRILDNNGTIRVFDTLGRRKHTFARRNGAKLDTDKMHLFSDYDKPNPVPRDYFGQAGLLTDYQWIIMSQKDTGRYSKYFFLQSFSI